LGAAVGVHLGGVDEGNPELHAGAKSADLATSVFAVLTHAPGTLTEQRDRRTTGKRRRAHRVHFAQPSTTGAVLGELHRGPCRADRLGERIGAKSDRGPDLRREGAEALDQDPQDYVRNSVRPLSAHSTVSDKA